MRHDRRMPNKRRAYRSQGREGTIAPAAGRPERSAAELAGAIGNTGMQQLARSPALRRSVTAARLLAGRPATLARRPREEDEIPEGVGIPTSMDDWLWEQQTMWEDHYKREEALIKYIEEHSGSGDDELDPLDDEETRRRLGLVHSPIESGLRY
jgi:hypothetical protein